MQTAGLKRGGKTQRCRHVLGTLPVTSFMTTCWLEHGKITDQQGTDSDGASQLVRRDHGHITIWEAGLASRLRAVGQKQAVRGANCGAGIDHFQRSAGFGIEALDRNNRASLTGKRGLQLLEIDLSLVKRDIHHLRIGRSTEHRIVLDRADDPAPYSFLADLRAVERNPQRLARAGGEDQLPVPAERRLAPRPCILQRGARLPPFRMGRGRVGPDGKALLHRCLRLGAERAGSGVIEIDAAQDRRVLME